MDDARREQIPEGVHTDGGMPTESDLIAIEKFKSFLKIKAEAEAAGLSKVDIHRYAAMEVYGNLECE